MASATRDPLVSVCIPSYNAGRTISDTIQSVLGSVYANLEVIINDDASTDDTGEVVGRFRDHRVRFYRNATNVGPVRNWNLALEKAAGDYVGLLNHDDLYSPFWLTFAVHSLGKYPHIGWVVSAFRIVDDKGRTLHLVSRFAGTGEISRIEAFIAAATLDGLGPGFLTRREILAELGGYDPKAGPGADNDLYLRLAARHPLRYCARGLVAWRLHSDNLTHRWGVVDQVAEGFYILQKTFDDATLPEDLRSQREKCYLYFCRKVKARLEALLEAGDVETARVVGRLLSENACGR